MKLNRSWFFGLILIVCASPAFAGTAVQMWSCEMEDDATEEAIEAKAAKWLAAVRKLDGGENLNAYVMFPIAVNATGETDMMFVVTAPTFAEWGKFWDAYPDSEVAANEEGLVVCPDSVIWESTKIE
jgi:hypothetical protein